jgi:hypothetical protein
MEEVRTEELEAQLQVLLGAQAEDPEEDRWTIACIQQMY